MPIDYSQYIRASDGSGEAVRAIVTSPRIVGDMDLIVDSVLNWPNKFIATSGDLDVATGLFDPDSICIFYATLSGSIIVIDEFAPGYSDVGHTTGQTVLLKPTTAWADAVSEGGGGGASVTIGDTPPASPEQGDLWGDTLGNDPNSLLTVLGEMLMPVGHILMNNGTNPASYLGFGTWTRIQGKFIVGVDDGDADFDLDDTGGAKDVTLTTSEMPVHTHGLNDPGHEHAQHVTANSGPYGRKDFVAEGPSQRYSQSVNTYAASTGITANNAGGGAAHENLPPYIAKYVWERTA